MAVVTRMSLVSRRGDSRTTMRDRRSWMGPSGREPASVIRESDISLARFIQARRASQCVASAYPLARTSDAQSVHSNRARRDNPKLVEVLRHNRWNMTAGSQPTKALDGFRMLRIFRVNPSRENICVEKNVHSPRSP